ncbi:hypothetical protein ASF19_00330 [Acidovorax sp. Leaf84]|nr:hypothetical protein ASF19_00330 [Acidovorax sp. Leaf84]
MRTQVKKGKVVGSLYAQQRALGHQCIRNADCFTTADGLIECGFRPFCKVGHWLASNIKTPRKQIRWRQQKQPCTNFHRARAGTGVLNTKKKLRCQKVKLRDVLKICEFHEA